MAAYLGRDYDLWILFQKAMISVEPSGGQIAGIISDDIWEDVEKEIDRSFGV